MKYLSLPVQLLRFWYPESLVAFLRAWKNSLLYLEEDLAVGLMFKLLFAPLFHDATFVGRLLSFCFRSTRILMGVFTFIVVTMIFVLLSLTWFLLPALAFITGTPGIIFKLFLFSGAFFYIYHKISHPAKKLWEIKNIKHIWLSSKVNKANLTLVKLLKTYEIKNFLNYLEKTPDNFSNLEIPNISDEVLKTCLELGRKTKTPYLTPEYFFVSALFHTSGIDNYLLKLDLTKKDLEETLEFLERRAKTWRMFWIWDEEFKVKHLKGINRGWLGVPTPNLDQVSEDLTRKASKEYIPDFVGRPEVVLQVVNILSLEKGRNVVLVGEPGSGRTELALYLSKLIIAGDAPDALATKRIVRLDMTRLLTGVTSQGDLAQKIKDVFEEVKLSGNIVVFIDEIQDLGLGEVGSEFNLYSLLLPYIEGSDFQFMATTEPGNYSKILGKNGSLARLFAKVEIPPASVSETVDILKNQAIEAEKNKKIQTSLIALQSLAELSDRYFNDLVLPDAALQVFENCLVASQEKWIKKSVVEQVVQTRVGVPVTEAKDQTKKDLLNLEEIIHQKFIDQEEAVGKVASVLRRSAAGLRDQKRPIGSFLFVGPTGVGKTELAKILVEEYFQGKGDFLRLDMSEYQTGDCVEKLIGKSGEPGFLTDNINQSPYSLILLDEFEKADPKILTLFLQVLDDGRLTSGDGKTVDFTNTIIIATSNVAALTIAQVLGEGKNVTDLEKAVRDELLTTFKPELVNRFDEVVIFKPLSPEHLQLVVKLKLVDLQNQLKEKGYLVEFDQELIIELAQKGFDPVLGARPLRRLIQDTLEAKLSNLILAGSLPKGEKFIADNKLLL